MTKINLLRGLIGSGGRMIPLTQGQYAIVDEAMYEGLNQYKWHADWDQNTKSYYASRNTPHPDTKIKTRQLTVCMSRVVLGLKYGNKKCADHINHDTIDNRQNNLRIVTPRQNHYNRKDQSPYGVGVSYQRDCTHRPYTAHIRVKGKIKHIGSFASAEEARQAKKAFEKEHDLV